jgi:type IV fimbrial biogenesis protein FimT
MAAVPAFRDTIRRNRVSAASNALLADLDYARTEAVNRGQLVSLCPSSDGSSCTTDGVAWEAGWLVYTYPAGAASANAAYAADNILLRATTAREGVAIRASSANVVSFGLQGQLRPGTELSFVTCMRDSSSDAGENSAGVPGARLDLTGSGSLSNKALGAGDACSP